ncbi:hypothetical protein DL768_005540 [Monosporascus sp. mg162]|nr:hypothetical protein DL768_005540 [Monosporascus sp. mg162]
MLNDRDSDVVARNAIILLLMFTQKNPIQAAESVLHIWYSAFVTKSVIGAIGGDARQLVQAAKWFSLLPHFELPTSLAYEKAKQTRLDITLAPERFDFRERRYFAQSPSRRTADMRFREEGIPLPFGSHREALTRPNPTMLRTIDSWPLKDDADPVDGWSIHDIQTVSGGGAANDVHGKLYLYLKKLWVKVT